GRTDPGVAAERPGGAGHRGAGVRAPAAAGPGAGGERRPGGLHQPRADHHPAEGPVRRRDPYPLPADAGGRARPRPAGGGDLLAGRRSGRGAAQPPGRGHREVHAAGASVARDRLPLRGLGPVRDRRGRGGRRLRGAAGGPPVTGSGARRPRVSTRGGRVEFEVRGGGGERGVLEPLLRRATADTYRARLGSADLSGLLATFEEGGSVETGDLVPATA